MKILEIIPENNFQELNKEIIVESAEFKIKTSENLALLKRKVSRKYKAPFPSNISLLKTYHEMVKNKSLEPSVNIERLLITRPVRSLSGVVNISVLTKPYPCPGKCLYCPKEKGVPESYVSGEPAVERAKKLKYSPYWQVKKRIEMLETEGHPTNKIELRIVGGTWSYYPRRYQKWFVKECFQASNQKENKAKPKSKKTTLENEQKNNENAKHRIIGLSVETRPDFINQEEVKHLRTLGVTLVELGIQSIYDEVLTRNLRGHGVKETIEATKILKDGGFKILYQVMLNLPGSSLQKDEKMFERLFRNQDFQPDFLKIYPCALLKEASLYKLWKKGQYRPYSKNQLINLIKTIKQKIPYYVRIQRISRDIPSFLIVAGPAKISNIRQMLSEKMKKEGWFCKCIRCREVKKAYDPKEKTYLFRQDYFASQGKEIFLSFENKKRTKLYSLLRLRITSDNKALIREIHTYGYLRSFKRNEKKNPSFSPQHKGLGRKLIKEAEKIGKKEFNSNRTSVIAGVGTRNYFRKMNYRLKDTYMIKKL